MQHKNWREFFERAGDHNLQPKSYGECLWPVSVEEMYRHFRQRLIYEITEASLSEGNDDLTSVLMRADVDGPCSASEVNAGE